MKIYAKIILLAVMAFFLFGCNKPPQVRSFESAERGFSVSFNKNGTVLLTDRGKPYVWFYEKQSSDHYKIYMNEKKSRYAFFADLYIYPTKAVVVTKDGSMNLKPRTKKEEE